MFKIYKKPNLKSIAVFIIALSTFSCQKTNTGMDNGIYPNDRTPAAVKFLSPRVSPVSGAPGITVTVPVSGLEGKQGQFKAFIGATEAPVTGVSATAITILVPPAASTGNITIQLNSQFFYGPNFNVAGKVYIDPDFNISANQATGVFSSVRGIVPYGDSYIVYGTFTKYGSVSCPGLAYIDNNGTTGSYQPYFGPENSLKLSPANITSIAPLDDGNFLMGGGFNSVVDKSGRTIGNLNGIARLFTNGDEDMIEVQQYRVPNADAFNFPERSWVTGSSVNGGAEGGAVLKVFATDDGAHYIAVGNFSKYVTTYYPGSQWNSQQQDRIAMKQLFSMGTDGSFDSSFNYNYATKASYAATNALINDATQASDGNIVIVGSFTTYNDAAANRIVKIDAYTGKKDPTFNTGSGFDGLVTSIKYNANTHRYLVTGLFKSYNGVPANNVVMLKEDGSVDVTFSVKGFGNGAPTFVKQLNNGLIICAGTFTMYDGVSRPGFSILNVDGSLAAGYNNTGNFNGSITDVIETTSKLTGQHAVFLVGSFSRFDATAVSNIVKVVIED
ncbi:DUF5008 domain-containing protein [Niabella sp.]|uniref:DUF5008 domain-containing protein n=1 Tax=Niabella sp. TaxID=1962976 RepID=UPI00262F0D87|nr:DUF5008 domain-containing protein [Niabella sp.]